MGADLPAGQRAGVMAGVVRARFREGQFLRAADLTVEQAYREDATRRHLLGAHPWGIVSGLELIPGRATDPVKDGWGITVEPGVAVDGFGRTVRVAAPVTITPATGDRDVWLSVVDDVPTVCAVPAGTVDPRHPPGAPPDVDAQPVEEAVAGAAGSWPVYLGRVSGEGKVSGTRPWAGLVGEDVRAPSGRARMQLAAESAAASTLFAVETEGGEDPDGALRLRLAMDAAGDVTVHGPTQVAGDLAVEPIGDGGIRFAPVPTPTAATPWSCYRSLGDRDQLRIEIEAAGDSDDPTAHRLVIGRPDAAGPFAPCLSVDAGRTVTVHGSLTVEGVLAQGPIRPSPTDPLFAAAASGGFLTGVAATGPRVAGFLAARLRVDVAATAGPESGKDFVFTVRIVSTGTGAVTDAQVFVVVGLPDRTLLTVRALQGVTFAAGSTTTVPHDTPKVPPGSVGRPLKVTVLVLGVNPARDAISATGSLTMTVGGHEE